MKDSEFLFGSIVYQAAQGGPEFEPGRVESLQGGL